jgi:hypothetical protein
MDIDIASFCDFSIIFLNSSFDKVVYRVFHLITSMFIFECSYYRHVKVIEQIEVAMKNGQSRHMGNNWNNTQNADAQSKTLNTVSFNNNTDPITNQP